MRTMRLALILVSVTWLHGCAASGRPPIKSLVEEVCDQYGRASRECRDYRSSYLY